MTMVLSSKKGKDVVGENSGRKRKRADANKTGSGGWKRKNSGVLRFIEHTAYEVDGDEDSDDDSVFSEDFQEDEVKTLVKFEVKTLVTFDDKPGKPHHFPFGYEVGELSGEELENLVEERYRPSSSFITYAEGEYEPRRLAAESAVALYEYTRTLVAENAMAPSSEDPTTWKVKCVVGREKHSAFCLMQKYMHLQSLGTKLNIISAFVIERVKGFIYIEAERQFDVFEACKDIFSVHLSCIAPVPKDEVSRLLSMQSKCNDVSVGSWARVKKGKYKGDLAEGGGILSKKSATPAPRLLNSTKLEEFRPLIQYRRDRDTGLFFEVLDGMMLKDGYLYKKVLISSLVFWGLMPSKEELLKFEPNKKDDSDCQEWLTQLYGEQEEKRIIKSGEGGLNGLGSSTYGFEVHDLVLFNRKDFGVIVGTAEDDSFKILKEGSEGPVVVTLKQKHLTKGSFAKKFTTLDRCSKTISVNDTVRVSEGPLEGWQGIVKQLFRGTVFLCDEEERENSGYICCKSQMCEKIGTRDDICNGEGDDSSSMVIDGLLLSSKSPSSPKKPLQTRGNNSNSNRENKGGDFSIGQSLRIKEGPMKGYLCHVMSVYRSDITVKLDSYPKILTVKREHLSQVHEKSSAVSLCEDAESVKPFGLLGTQDCSGADSSSILNNMYLLYAFGNNNCEDTFVFSFHLVTLKLELKLVVLLCRKSWPAFPSSGLSLQQESKFANPLNSANNDIEGKAAGNRRSMETLTGSKTAWNGSLTEPKNQTGGPSWSKQPRLNNRVQSAEMTVRNDCSGNKPFSGKQGFGGWNKNGMGNYEEHKVQQKGWDATKTFNGGRGSGGRNGRGSVRGGRNQFGRGRTSTMNPSSWNGGEDKRSDKGGCGGRGGFDKIRGIFGGRGGSNSPGHRGGRGYNRGGFRGRGERGGGFGGPGRGMRNQNGEWSNEQVLAFDGGENERSNRGGFSRGRGRLQRGGFGGRGRGDQSRASGTGVGAGAGAGGRGWSQRGGFGGRGRGDQRNASGTGAGAGAGGWNRQVSNVEWVWNKGRELDNGGASGTRNFSNEVGETAEPWHKASAGSSGNGNGGGGRGRW
ncbi:hypothetical protein Vadar_011407 [Vaccinium darrowii]|uniref:Uncharacterized protein n=1 Tax=Vaccinium darrowii TaxID=229202 RepID=A0ACB7XHI2_9ERIC|nr:hypothetical protein Vadar_011407 [Vaccinium darrowii]